MGGGAQRSTIIGSMLRGTNSVRKVLHAVKPSLGFTGRPEHVNLVGHLAQAEFAADLEDAPMMSARSEVIGDMLRHRLTIVCDEHTPLSFTVHEQVRIGRSQR